MLPRPARSSDGKPRVLIAVQDSRRVLIVAELIADRLEGKPVRQLRREAPHQTFFHRADGPNPSEVEQAERRRAAEAGQPGHDEDPSTPADPSVPTPATLEVLAPPPPRPARRFE